MADVRALLRSERACRRINHPQATYSTTGTLVCLVCHIQLKSESLWDSHLKSAQHAMRLQRIRDGTLGRPPGAPAPTSAANGSKKRKADDEEGTGRKKSKPAMEGVPEGFFDTTEEIGNGNGVGEDVVEKDMFGERPSRVSKPQNTDAQAPGLPVGFFDPSTKGAPSANTIVDEDEWAAFERDVASPLPAASVPSALKAAATISAAPLSAAELAARTTAEASIQKKELKEEELEGEREDAARQLEEEFDQMEELESRVRRLRAKREELRHRSENVEITQMDINGTAAIDDVEGSDDDLDGDEDGWDNWRHRG
ncbi:MAG: hypothetical protein M1830_000303 [Pleopsidium flavum]|nr:MAG: hypothetical protein M1830_000303 [Pleopsidium flavum]